MKSVNQIVESARNQLTGLSAPSKLLIGCLVVILGMSLFIVSLYAGRSTLVPLPVTLTGTNRAQVVDYLNGRGIEWVDRAGEIAVPAEERHGLLAEMTDREIISPDTIDFDALVAQESPFLSKAQNERRWLVATMNQLERTIARMRGVSRATVVIDEPSRPGGIGRAHIPPSASVTVTMRSGVINQEQVNAIASMVAGAHAELGVTDVEVIDAGAGRAHRAADDRTLGTSRYLELQAEHTRVYEEKLRQALAYIPGVNVAVNVIVDHRDVIEESRRFDDPKSGLTEEATRTLSQTNQPAAFEPGVRSNTGASINGSSGRTSSLADERSESSLKPVFGGTDSRTHDPGGFALKVNASIGVPRSYFERLYGSGAGSSSDDATPPTPQELDAIVQVEVGRIRAQVQPLIDTGPKGGEIEGAVAVSMIPDYGLADAATAGGGMLGPGGLLSDQMIKYAGLGMLALVSLGMMFMMVRRAAERVEVPSLEELEGAAPPPGLGSAEVDIAGEAGATLVPLDGMELDEDTLRRQQMVEQINELSKSTPEEGARILQRWAQEESA